MGCATAAAAQSELAASTCLHKHKFHILQTCHVGQPALTPSKHLLRVRFPQTYFYLRLTVPRVRVTLLCRPRRNGNIPHTRSNHSAI